ncbi:MAG TPA: hypothetical protein VMH04_10125 [Candidatus Solibacter sp.]|nr:hypothetical protein [Candidatus Solibacter sp.]
MQTKRFTARLSFALLSSALIVMALAIASVGQQSKTKPHRFRYVDLGTLGGPTSSIDGGGGTANNRGMFIPNADLSIQNPNFNNFNPYLGQDAYVNHAALWSHGVLTDLGALPGGFNSFPVWIDAAGTISGFSENGDLDPIAGVPAIRAVLWKNGKMIDLGTLGGYESLALETNSHGQIIGMAANSEPDSFPDPGFCASFGTQTRAFAQNGGAMQDLGTLGGPDAFAFYNNEANQVIGVSYTSFTPGPAGLWCDGSVPPVHPFLWQRGHMRDLGTLGGDYAAPFILNQRGQVVGFSLLNGNSTAHPFLWPGPHGAMVDLGTLGGDNGQAGWINDSGVIVGEADLPGSQVHHATVWKDGRVFDLGTVDGDPCSSAFIVNSIGQVIGGSGPCGVGGHSWFWDGRGPIIDLARFLPPNSGIILQEPNFINDRGEIVGRAILPNGDEHAFAMIPCDQSDGNPDCREADPLAPATSIQPTSERSHQQPELPHTPRRPKRK